MEERLTRVETLVEVMAKEMPEMKEAMTTIAKSLSELAVLNEKNNNLVEALKRAFKTIERNTNRIDELEETIKHIQIALPPLQLTSGWVFKTVLFVMGLLGAGTVGLLIKESIKTLWGR